MVVLDLYPGEDEGGSRGSPPKYKFPEIKSGTLGMSYSQTVIHAFAISLASQQSSKSPKLYFGVEIGNV